MRKIITLSFIIFLLFPSYAPKAASKSYEIDNVTINTKVNSDGSVDVNEFLTYDFKGDFNGITREIRFDNGSIDFKSFSVVDNNEEKNFQSNDSEKDNTYEIKESSEKIELKAYSKSSNEKKTFKLTYRLNNIMYMSKEGIPILNWKFYDVDNIPKVNNAKLTVELDNYSLSDINSTYKTSTKSDLETYYQDGLIVISYKDLSDYLSIELKMPKDYFTVEIKEKSNTDMKILVAGLVTFLVTGIGIVAAVLISKRKFNKALKAYRDTYTFDNVYNCDSAPSDLPPAIVHNLYKEGKYEENLIGSTLFYLVSKGVYRIKNTDKYSKEDLILKRNRKAEIPNYEHIKFFIEWFENYAILDEFSIAGINKKLKGKLQNELFFENLTDFKYKVIEDCDNLVMFRTIKNKKVLSNEYKNQLNKWEAYKNFILDQMNRFDIKFDVDVVNDMVIYANALDVEFEEINKFCVKIHRDYGNAVFGNTTFMYLYYYPLIGSSSNSFNSTTPIGDSSGGFTGGYGGGGFSGGGGGGSGAF